MQPSINAALSSMSVINHIGAAKQLVGDVRNSVVAFEALKQPQEQMRNTTDNDIFEVSHSTLIEEVVVH